MSDYIERGLYLGIGAFAMTKERAEKLANELIEKGRLTREEAPSFLKDITAKAEAEKKAFEKGLHTVIEKAVEQLNLPTQKDLQKIEEKLDRICDLLQERP